MQNLLFPTDPTSTADASGEAVIFRDLKWVDRSPTVVIEPLRNGQPTGELHRVPLRPEAFIGFDTRAEALQQSGLTTRRWCSGYAQALTEETGFRRVPCPEHATIDKGKQCARCAARDEFSAMHGIHRGLPLPPAAEPYAALEHWLYIATFPDGTSKVGTASALSRPRRLDEQAVACATYVAHAHNGRQVRVLEDMVSAEAQLVQVKQNAAKYRAWTNPLPAPDLKRAHEQAVSLATWTLQEAALFEDALDEEQIIAESWVPSKPMARAYASLRAEDREPLSAYPSVLDAAHGFHVLGAAGKFVVAHFGDLHQAFLINTHDLQNRAMLPYGRLTEPPQTQDSLF